MADELVKRVYQEIELPKSETYGMRSQIRRAAVSVPVNIVEGCQRKTDKDYMNFLRISMGSAAEVGYLLRLCSELDLCDKDAAISLSHGYWDIVKMLQGLIDRIDADNRQAVSG
jgi:four helix bundle protein